MAALCRDYPQCLIPFKCRLQSHRARSISFRYAAITAFLRHYAQTMNLPVQNSAKPLPVDVRVSRSGPSGWTLPAPRFSGAMQDLARGLFDWRLWMTLAWDDVRQRYRRSFLGPFWLTLSMGLMIGTLGGLYAQIFKIPTHEYLPFLCVGLVVWSFISTTISEGATCLIAAEGMIRQLRMPLSAQVNRSITRNMIILLHNFVIYIAIIFIMGLNPGFLAFMAVPGFILLIINLGWISLLLGLLSARFRDIPPLVASILQIVMFLTPIMWSPDSVREQTVIFNANPVYHLIELVRAPLLGHQPTGENYVFVGCTTLVGWAITFPFFARFRSRVAYWL